MDADVVEQDVEQIDAPPAEGVEEVVEEVTPKPAAGDGGLSAAAAELRNLTASLKEGTAPKEPELTEEQKAEFWAVYQPDKSRKDFFNKWFRLNPDATPEEIKEVKEMWAEVQTGIVRQSIVGSRNFMDARLKEFNEQLKPLFNYVSEQRATQTRDRFFKGYEALSDPKYAKIVDAAARGLDGKDFKNEEEYFKALAESAAETIKGVVPEFDLGKKIEKKPAGSTPRLPRTSVGSTGGAGKGAGEKESSGTAGDIDSL